MVGSARWFLGARFGLWCPPSLQSCWVPGPGRRRSSCAVWVCVVVVVCWAARLSSSTLHQYPRLWGVGGFILGAFVVQMLDHPKRCETRGL